ncbi:MAG: ArsR/SmtB family transcription factor [Candidatus Ranarchaeia archaeon]
MKEELPSCDEHYINESELKEISKKLPEEKIIDEAAIVFKTLGSNTRMRILTALNIRDFCVGELAFLLDMSITAISHQLKILRDLRLVKFQKKGNIVYYSFDDEHILNLIKNCIIHVKE